MFFVLQKAKNQCQMNYQLRSITVVQEVKIFKNFSVQQLHFWAK